MEPLDLTRLVDLRPKDPSSLLTADAINTAWAAIRSLYEQAASGADAAGQQALANASQPVTRDVIAIAVDDAVPAYSICALTNHNDAEPGLELIAVRQVDVSEAHSPLALFTTDRVAAGSGSKTLVTPLSRGTPRYVRITGDEPKLGHPCGVVPGTWGVGAGWSGLTCLGVTTRQDESGSVDVALVVAGDGSGLVARMTSDVEPYNRHTREVKSGTAELLYRKLAEGSGDDTLEDSIDLGGSGETLELDIVNVLSIILREDDVVFLLPSANVGMIAIPLQLRQFIWGFLNDELSYGGSASMSVCEFDHETDEQFDTDRDEIVWDVKMNVGSDPFAALTRLDAHWDWNSMRYCLGNINCEPEAEENLPQVKEGSGS